MTTTATTFNRHHNVDDDDNKNNNDDDNNKTSTDGRHRLVVEVETGDDAEGPLGVVVQLPGSVHGGLDPVADVAVVALEGRGEGGGQGEGEGEVVLPRRQTGVVLAAGTCRTLTHS